MASPSGPSATATEPAVVPSSTAESAPATPAGPAADEEHNPTSPVDDEKRHSTSRRPSLPHHASSPIPTDTPVLGAAGFVLEDEEKADAAATAFKHHQSPPPAAPHENGTAHEKKEPHVVEENGVATTATGTTTETELTQEESEAEADEEVVFPGNTQLALLTFGLCVATFTVALDNTIIATAIPKITSVFDSLDDVGWYGSSYLLTTTALQPSFGRIYTYFNVKYVYMFALVLFELGSVICAAARNSVMLIVGRAVAGAGASALFSGAMTIVGFTVPLKKRPIYMASISSMFGIASVVGPLLGGVFTDKLTWRWCFWINLPFGAIALATVFFYFKPPQRKSSGLTTKEKILEIDLVGALFLICAIVCLLLALQWGGSKYPWHDSKVWGCMLGFGLLIIIFIAQQFRRGERATIPPRIFGQRTVLFACLYSAFMSMGLYTHIFYLPFYFQAVKGTTAEQSGIRTIPYLGSIIVSSIIVGGGITAIGWYKPFMIVGGAIFTVGAGMIYTLQVPDGAAKWIGYQLLSGFGAGGGVQIPFIAVQVVLSAKDMPTGNAMAIFFNSLGGAIAISIAQNIFSNGLKSNLPKYAPDVSPEVVINAGAAYLRKVITPAQLPGVLLAYMDGLKQAFIISIACGAIATICACFVEWKSVKGKKIAAVAA
ncbi:MFS general substrate transporter [Stipitochalara longipes BDJ]|nr:MFS general substrate transporter [Stipitochalara longipes BDJ]